MGSWFAHAQCDPQWLPGSGVAGADGPVYVMMNWDVDADGPQAPVLIVGGDFRVIGDVAAANIAMWDGMKWHALGSGMNGTVKSLGVFQQSLVAGGEFTIAGDVQAKRVARWHPDTQSWSGFGTGISSGSVDSLVEYQGELVAAGLFSIVEPPTALYIAKFNGSSWMPMGNFTSRVNALAIFQNELIAGGNFTNYIVKRVDDNWEPLGTGPNGEVVELTVFNGELIAAGHFTAAGEVPTHRAARWNGTQWQTLGPWPVDDQFIFTVRALGIIDNALYASTQLTNGIQGHLLNQWTGGGWMQVSDKLNLSIEALGTLDESFFVGGTFTTSEGRYLPFIARLDSSSNQWRPIHIPPHLAIGPLTRVQGQWYAAGTFMTDDAGSTRNTVAQWNERTSAWEPFGPDIVPTVLGEYKGALIAGGTFSQIAGIPINGVARWNGNSWQPLGEGVLGEVHALVQWEHDLYAGGAFISAGGQPANHVARWDGTSWHPLGQGIEPACPECPVVVYALSANDQQLIAAGRFAYADGNQAMNIAVWNGSSWMTLGTGVGGTIYDVIEYHGDWYVTGTLATSFGEPTPGLMRWDGSTWGPVVSNLTGAVYGGTGYALEIFRNELILGGRFSHVDGVPAKGIARWDGSAWQPVGGSVDGPSVSNFFSNVVFHLLTNDNDMFVSGGFSLAGHQVSATFARAVHTSSAADLTCDGVVSALDLLVVLNAWGDCPSPPASCDADIAPAPGGDGVVNVLDLLFVVSNWD